MTREDAKKMLKAKLECLIRETSGTGIDCNYKNCDECNLCYEQGNMGEQKEALELAIKALEQELMLDNIRAEIACHIIEDDTSGNTPARIRADWAVANKAHLIDIAILDKYKAESEE